MWIYRTLKSKLFIPLLSTKAYTFISLAQNFNFPKFNFRWKAQLAELTKLPLFCKVCKIITIYTFLNL